MKRLMFIMMLYASQILWAQNPESKQKFIEVNASAEMEVVPDEVYVSMTLQEYKDGSTKVSIAELEKGMRDVLSSMKIDEKLLSIESSYGYQYHRRKHKDKDFFMSKTYQLKMSDLGKYDELIARLDDKGISQVYISKTSLSKAEEFKRTLKINAAKAAKEKAKYLLEAINEQLGEALEIHEIDAEVYYPVYANKMMGMAQDNVSANGGSELPIEMKKIKMKQSISAKFAIK